MKILMVSSECVPYAKSGGLADVVAALSRQLNNTGHDVRILLPGYSFLDLNKSETIIDNLNVVMGFREENLQIVQKILPESKVKVYFAKHPLFTKRTGIYGKHGSHAYRDNHYRFALLSAAAFSLSIKINWIPNIIHSHDWPAGLAASYLRENKKNGSFMNTESVFTIHNTGYQGNFSKYDILSTGLKWDKVSKDKANYIDEINFLKSGIENSKAVTTVSPGYAEEIKIEGFGHGLEKLLVSKKDAFSGILNGADYSEWDPEQDKLLELNFSAKKLNNKWKLKEKLQKKAGLSTDKDKALIGMVGRLVDQKGFGELCKKNDNTPGAIRKICENKDIQLIILGTGEKWIEDDLKALNEELPNLKVYLNFDNALAHLIEAGSDFFLMPSKYEPCGLNQVYSLKYGSIPIVRATGGLKDTVVDYFTDKKNSTGFHIPEMTSESIVNTIKSAIDLWGDNKESIGEIRQRGMMKEFLWSEYAEEYEALYTKCLDHD
ncbi:MAG: glycogen/starch synthase [Spirochaetia bacterium]|jgi:starch synthase|nr:glycogen/starch synthase [Spirochaetia bacterium]